MIAEEKGSTYRVKRSTGIYSFRIEGFSGLSTRAGDSTESPEFDLCGHTWQLRIFPGGSLSAYKGFLSYYLASKSTRPARASYKLILCRQLPGGADETFASSGVRLFQAKGLQIDGRNKFIANNVICLPENGFCINDIVIFRVEVTVFGELEEISAAPGVFVGPPSLSTCMKGLLECDEGFDVEIGFGGAGSDRLKAHRCILKARSPVFRVMLSSHMTEETTGLILISDIDIVVMHELLVFLYTDECTTKSLETMGMALFCAACKYQIHGLISICESHFMAQINVESAVALLLLADAYNSMKLRDHCIKYVANHAEDIMQSKEFGEIETSLRQEIDAVIDRAAKCDGGRGMNRNTDESRAVTSCFIL